MSRHLPENFNPGVATFRDLVASVSFGASTVPINMPVWRKAARIVLAIPPTSAASERMFSLLEAMFGKDQDATLSDLIQSALMLRYNKRRVG